MKTKFTPGPWHIEHQVIYSGEKLFAMLLMQDLIDGEGQTNDEEIRANTTLIAAAPDMLAVLQEVAKGQNCELKGDFIVRVSALAKAVIAKAIGEKEQTL